MKIIFLLLNDEYANIRKKACEIFMIFNNLTNILSISDSKMCYINDYLCQKIISKINLSNEIYKKFGEYILNNNFYFRTNIVETKVFYLEPDNNYIDNYENKMIILKNILKNKYDKNIFDNNNININYNVEKDNYKIMIVFEEFTDIVKNICKILIKNKTDEKKDDIICENDTSMKYIYKNMIRPQIYLLNK